MSWPGGEEGRIGGVGQTNVQRPPNRTHPPFAGRIRGHEIRPLSYFPSARNAFSSARRVRLISSSAAFHDGR